MLTISVDDSEPDGAEAVVAAQADSIPHRETRAKIWIRYVRFILSLKKVKGIEFNKNYRFFR
jgi:hypothetical protein